MIFSPDSCCIECQGKPLIHTACAHTLAAVSLVRMNPSTYHINGQSVNIKVSCTQSLQATVLALTPNGPCRDTIVSQRTVRAYFPELTHSLQIVLVIPTTPAFATA